MPAQENLVASERQADRRRLRPVQHGDLAAFHALEATLRARQLPPRAAPTLESSARYLARFVEVWEQGELGYWTILSEGVIAGFGGVQPKQWSGRRCWNLYYRLDPHFQGAGVATETAREAIVAAHERHPGWPVLVETRPDNEPAIGVAERAGLTRIPPAGDDEYAVLVLEACSSR